MLSASNYTCVKCGGRAPAGAWALGVNNAVHEGCAMVHIHSICAFGVRCQTWDAHSGTAAQQVHVSVRRCNCSARKKRSTSQSGLGVVTSLTAAPQ